MKIVKAYRWANFSSLDKKDQAVDADTHKFLLHELKLKIDVCWCLKIMSIENISFLLF